MSDNKNARLGYSDFLRCLATLAVVTLHCAGATLAARDPSSLTFLGLNILDGLCRWAVPMFVMLSGMFLLDLERELSRKKWLSHLARLALVILIWGFFYALWDARAAHFGAEWLLEGLISMVTGRLHYHLWFLPMLLGLYLLIPPLRGLVRGSSRRVLWYAVGLWGVVAVTLPTLFALVPNSPGSAWLGLLDLRSVAGYPGFFLLGYLLKTCQPSRRQEGAVYALGVAGAVVTVWGTQVLSQTAGSFQAPLYGYLTPNALFIAAALFLLARRLDLGKGAVWSKLSGLTFGVYLLHPFFLELLQALGFPDPAWNAVLAALIQVPVLLAAAGAADWVLRHIPKLGKRIC